MTGGAPEGVVGDVHIGFARSRATSFEVAPGSAQMPAQCPGQSERSVGPIARKSTAERVGVVGVDDGVEDQPLDVVRIGARVGDRQFGAVGDPEQRELLDAQSARIASMSCDGVRRRVVVARDADPVRAVLGRGGVAQVRVALEPRAAQQPGAAGAALVVADQLEAASSSGSPLRTPSISLTPAPPGPPERYISVGPERLPARAIRRLIVPGVDARCDRAGR